MSNRGPFGCYLILLPSPDTLIMHTDVGGWVCKTAAPEVLFYFTTLPRYTYHATYTGGRVCKKTLSGLTDTVNIGIKMFHFVFSLSCHIQCYPVTLLL